jgi:hypothetical protein
VVGPEFVLRSHFVLQPGRACLGQFGREVSKVSCLLASARCPLFCKAEIIGALDGHFLCDFEKLADDVEIFFLFLVDHAIGCESGGCEMSDVHRPVQDIA